MSGKKARKREKASRKTEKARVEALAAHWAEFDLESDGEEPSAVAALENGAHADEPGLPGNVGPIAAEARDARRVAHARLLGYASAAALTPEERSAKARKAGLASAAKRRAERARLGIPDPKPRRASLPQPTMLELEDFVAEILKRDPSKSWSQTALRSQAIAEMKLHVARQTFESERKLKS